jgi:hypothetical protein
MLISTMKTVEFRMNFQSPMYTRIPDTNDRYVEGERLNPAHDITFLVHSPIWGISRQFIGDALRWWWRRHFDKDYGILDCGVDRPQANWCPEQDAREIQFTTYFDWYGWLLKQKRLKDYRGTLCIERILSENIIKICAGLCMTFRSYYY